MEVDYSVQEQVEILKLQLADGELPRCSTYEWDAEACEFRVAVKPMIN